LPIPSKSLGTGLKMLHRLFERIPGPSRCIRGIHDTRPVLPVHGPLPGGARIPYERSGPGPGPCTPAALRRHNDNRGGARRVWKVIEQAIRPPSRLVILVMDGFDPAFRGAPPRRHAKRRGAKDREETINRAHGGPAQRGSVRECLLRFAHGQASCPCHPQGKYSGNGLERRSSVF
jgi:hypothetical protein